MREQTLDAVADFMITDMFERLTEPRKIALGEHPFDRERIHEIRYKFLRRIS